MKNTINATFKTAGLGIGLGIIGEGFNQPNISSAGETATGFIKPMVNIGMAGKTINMLKDLNKRKK